MNPWTIWIPVGKTEEYGRVYLVQYAEQSRSEVAYKIMSRAWKEGFRGTLDERLKELDWEIVECELKELVHEPSRDDQEDEAADAERFRWLLSGKGYFMEEHGLCGCHPSTKADRHLARKMIDEARLNSKP